MKRRMEKAFSYRGRLFTEVFSVALVFISLASKRNSILTMRTVTASDACGVLGARLVLRLVLEGCGVIGDSQVVHVSDVHQCIRFGKGAAHLASSYAWIGDQPVLR